MAIQKSNSENIAGNLGWDIVLFYDFFLLIMFFYFLDRWIKQCLFKEKKGSRNIFSISRCTLILPFRICTRTEDAVILVGSQAYMPESFATAFWISSLLVVVVPFSVSRDMPPRGESNLMICGIKDCFKSCLNIFEIFWHLKEASRSKRGCG